MKAFFLICFGYFSVITMHGQTACENSLIEARKLYKAGHFAEVIKMLEPCVDKGLLIDEKFDAYHLLALSYLNLSDENSAAKNIKAMLVIKPDYQKFPGINPAAFRNLLNAFVVTPKVELGIQLGTSLSWIHLNQSYSVVPGNVSYTPQLGIQLGVVGNWHFNTKYALMADVAICRKTIAEQLIYPFNWIQKMQENHTYIKFTPSLITNITAGKKGSFILGLGPALFYMSNAVINIEHKEIIDNVKFFDSKSVINERNKWQWCATILGGYQYSLAKGSLGLMCSYYYFLNNTVNGGKRMSDLSFITKNQFVADNVAFRDITLSLVYKVPIQNEIIHKTPTLK
jgi:hypothetical protein